MRRNPLTEEQADLLRKVRLQQTPARALVRPMNGTSGGGSAGMQEDGVWLPWSLTDQDATDEFVTSD